MNKVLALVAMMLLGVFLISDLWDSDNANQEALLHEYLELTQALKEAQIERERLETALSKAYATNQELTDLLEAANGQIKQLTVALDRTSKLSDSKSDTISRQNVLLDSFFYVIQRAQQESTTHFQTICDLERHLAQTQAQIKTVKQELDELRPQAQRAEVAERQSAAKDIYVLFVTTIFWGFFTLFVLKKARQHFARKRRSPASTYS